MVRKQGMREESSDTARVSAKEMTQMEFKHVLPRLRIVQREEYLLAKCQGRRVLHLGAVDHYKGEVCGLHKRLMNVADYVAGIDIDKSGIEQARLTGIRNILYGDLEKLGEINASERFDVIVAGEVIEHLSNPGLFLEGIKRFIDPRVEMIVTTPNVFSLHRYLLMLGRFEYVHPDHVCYYSLTTLRHLMERHSFTIEEELAYVLEGRLRNLRKLLSRISILFANGLILVVRI